MRLASVSVLALAFGCSSPVSDPPGGAGGTTTMGGTGGASPSSGGSTTPSSGGTSTTGGTVSSGGVTSGGMSSGGVSSGGSSSGGVPTNGGSSQGGSTNSNGGSSKGGANSSGASNGGANSGGNTNGKGGRMNGGGAGSTSSGGAPAGGTSTSGGSGGSSGGAGGCVKNLVCKLDPPPSSGDIYQDCVDRINQFLTKCACLPALTRRTDGEACANQMAEYDASKNSPHAGAIANICTPGGSQNECPGYASNAQVIGLCMQQMWDEGPPPTSTCTGSCYEEHGHFINMTEKGITKVACGFYTTSSGKVWAVQNFSR